MSNSAARRLIACRDEHNLPGAQASALIFLHLAIKPRHMTTAPLALVALGDSLTQGIGDEEQLGWVGRLAQKVAQSRELTFYNLGVHGNTSLDLSRRVQAELEVRLEPGCDATLLSQATRPSRSRSPLGRLFRSSCGEILRALTSHDARATRLSL